MSRTRLTTFVTIAVLAVVAVLPAAAGRPDRDAGVIETSRIAPRYPAAAAYGGFEASVLLAVLVGRDGSVLDVHVSESTNQNLGFELAAEDAVRQWRFRPARRDGQQVESVTWHRMRFRAPDPVELAGMLDPGLGAGRIAASTGGSILVPGPAPARSAANARVIHAWAPPYPSRPGQLYDIRSKPRYTASVAAAAAGQ